MKTSLLHRFPSRTLLQRGDLALSFRARDSVLDRDVFIKILNPALADDEEIRARFEREAKAVARLDHPNLVRIYEYGQDADEGLFMLLEWVEGANLADYLKAQGRLAADELMVLARDLLAGVGALHSVGIVHRDLKPENVLVRLTPPGPPVNGGEKKAPLPPTSEGEKSYPPHPPKQVGGEKKAPLPPMSGGEKKRGEVHFKITDFSLAALRDAPALTHHEAIVGTPAYMSPEQAAGGRVTEKTDLFALGVMLYEAATGENPFVSHSMLDTMRRIRESDISFVHAKFRALPDPLRILIERLLHKNPEQRPESAHEAVEWLAGKTIPAVPGKKSASKMVLIAAALILAALLAVLLAPDKIIDPVVNTLPQVNGDSTGSPGTDFRPGEDTPLGAEKSDSGHSGTGATAENGRRDSVPVKPKEQFAATIPVDTGLRGQNHVQEIIPDSVDLYLTTEPWAHIYARGMKIATTPLEKPLRLPSGEQILTIKNPAFPDLNLPFKLSKALHTENVRLAEYTTLIKLDVQPWGECYVDGEHTGTTPLAKPLYLSPGRHSLRFSHPAYAALTRDILAAAGETINIHVDFSKGEFVLNGAGKPQ